MADVLTRVGQFVKERYQDDPDELDHVQGVSAMAQTLDDQIVALLHDLVEDAFASWEEVADILGADADRLLPALRLLTRDDEPYANYIERIAASGNLNAINVKTFDLFDHLSPYKRAGLLGTKVDRYLAALDRLVRLPA
jgi:hypothetical protein